MRALVLVDLQNDFCPGGSLPVPAGHEVLAPANALARAFEIVVATQDWHPPHHASFASQHEGRVPGAMIELHGLDQVLWPDHCVRGTHGAAFHPDLDLSHLTGVFRKGQDPTVDSYSAFHDNGHRHATGLADWLRSEGVDEIYVCGLALDYCVKYTVLDGLAEGFRTVLVEDACRAVDLDRGDGTRAVEVMRTAGAEVMTSAEVLERLQSAPVFW